MTLGLQAQNYITNKSTTNKEVKVSWLKAGYGINTKTNTTKKDKSGNESINIKPDIQTEKVIVENGSGKHVIRKSYHKAGYNIGNSHIAQTYTRAFRIVE